MDCRTFHKNLEDYLEGSLDFPGRFGMERHAQQCYVCGKGMATALRLSDLAKEIGRASAPANLEASILARIHARDRRSWIHEFWVYRFEWPSSRSLALAASAIVLVGVAAFLAAKAISWSAPEQTRLLTQHPVQKVTSSTLPQRGEQASLPAPFPPPLSTPAKEVSAPFVKSASFGSARRPGPSTSYSTEEDWAGQPVQAGDADYLEYQVPGQGTLIMRLPKTIRMRHAEPSQEHFIRNVSH